MKEFEELRAFKERSQEPESRSQEGAAGDDTLEVGLASEARSTSRAICYLLSAICYSRTSFRRVRARFAQSVRCVCGNRGLRLRADRVKLCGNQGAGTIPGYNLPRRTTDVWSVCPCGLHRPGCRLARRSTLEFRKARGGGPFVLQ